MRAHELYPRQERLFCAETHSRECAIRLYAPLNVLINVHASSLRNNADQSIHREEEYEESDVEDEEDEEDEEEEEEEEEAAPRTSLSIDIDRQRTALTLY